MMRLFNIIALLLTTICVQVYHVQAQFESSFACCHHDGEVVYDLYAPCNYKTRGISTWRHFRDCWQKARVHFGSPQAKLFKTFVLVLDEHAGNIDADARDLPLVFDADWIPNTSMSSLPFLDPFRLQIGLPMSAAGRCVPFELKGLAIEMVLHRPDFTNRMPASLTLGISGCSRALQSISNMSFHALGFGNLELSFLTLRDSHDIVSVEPSHIESFGSFASSALSFEECDLLSSTFRYFGDVEGSFGSPGSSIGLSDPPTQNGSRAIKTAFLVERPEHSIPGYNYRPAGIINGYQFCWYGSFPEEWGNIQGSFTHMQDCFVEYIRDVALGTVSISNSKFSPWLSPDNPTFRPDTKESAAIPPAIEIYKMEAGVMMKNLEHTQRKSATHRDFALQHGSNSRLRQKGTVARLLYGCNISDSLFHYIWDVRILESAVSNSKFAWVGQGLPVPASWARQPPVNPSFWLALQTFRSSNGFLQSVNDTLACMRPELDLHGEVLPNQTVTVDDGSYLFGSTRFMHTSDAACKTAAEIHDDAPSLIILM